MNSPIIARALEMLRKADTHIAVRIGIVGTLAMAVVAEVLSPEEQEEAREIVRIFWQELEGQE